MNPVTVHIWVKRILDALLLIVTLMSLGVSFWEEAPEWAGVSVLAGFVLLFGIRWKVSDDKRGYLRSNWIDLVLVVLLSSPFLRLLVAFKIGGLAPVLKLSAALRANRDRLVHMLIISGESLPAAMALVFAVVFVFGAGTYMLEHGVNPAFRDINDGLWWAFVTLTTVGYGDIVPITPQGRVVAVIAMLFGITLYSLMIANLTYFVEEVGKSRRFKTVETKGKENGVTKKLTAPNLNPMVRRPRKLRLKKIKTL